MQEIMRLCLQNKSTAFSYKYFKVIKLEFYLSQTYLLGYIQIKSGILLFHNLSLLFMQSLYTTVPYCCFHTLLQAHLYNLNYNCKERIFIRHAERMNLQLKQSQLADYHIRVRLNTIAFVSMVPPSIAKLQMCFQFASNDTLSCCLSDSNISHVMKQLVRKTKLKC